MWLQSLIVKMLLNFLLSELFQICFLDVSIFCDERRVEEDKKREERGEQKIGNILDKENGKLNFNNKTATSMGSNKRVYIIEPTDEDLETKRENLKIKIMEKYLYQR